MSNFVGYRTAVNEGRIDEWLGQFAARDRDLAARVLDAVEFYGPDRIANAYRSCLSALPGWSATKTERTGRWRFVQLSESAGDSGGTMMHHFRLANKLDGKLHNEMFIFPSQLVQEQLGPDDTVVMLDDFIGTGHQVTAAWQNAFSELVANVGTVYLLVVAARRRGRDRVKQETGLSIQYAFDIDDCDDFFSIQCRHFTADEKAIFLKYCKKASRRQPAGYGDCGLTVVFSHRCPNDSVAALHATHSKWHGLFPRHDELT